MDNALTLIGYLLSGACGCVIGAAFVVLSILLIANGAAGRKSPLTPGN